MAEIADATRSAPEAQLGVGMRGCMAFVRAAKTWAASHGRSFVAPDDIKDLALPVLGHRILLDPEAEFAGANVTNLISRVLSEIAPPADRAA